jgi:4-hydroxy-L-threonine phosphate dehydrogenase PdxA
MNSIARPYIGTIIGDPNGIGPEVVVRAWTSGRAHAVSRPILIGSAAAIYNAIEACGVNASIRVIDTPDQASDDPSIISIIDKGDLATDFILPGTSNAACGYACAMWIDQATQMVRAGLLDGLTLAPIDSRAMKLAGVLDRVVNVKPGETYAFLISGALRVAHVTDHLPLREVCELLSADLIESALMTLDGAMRGWGMAEPRIVVAGLNPHAQGREEADSIKPGIERARQRGVNAYGPDSPDAIFRQCIEGKYDAVLAMYHDQGHIAVKTWGFSGNCVLVLGLPYLFLSVAHGTAHDIVGQGVADPTMMINAMALAGSLAAGNGFGDTA